MEYRILGALEVVRAGQALPISGARQRRLLAMLLVNAKAVVPHARLVDDLWETAPATTRGQVHNAVATLRRTLGDVGIVTSDAGYQINVPDEALDTALFRGQVRKALIAESKGQVETAVESLQSALSLWRGPALAGFEGRHLAVAATRLDEERLSALERLCALSLITGGHSIVVSDLFTHVAEHPYRESLRAMLMLALYRSGRQTDALAVYDQGRRLLADEIGVDPGPVLLRLREQIVRYDPALDGPGLAPLGLTARIVAPPGVLAAEPRGADEDISIGITTTVSPSPANAVASPVPDPPSGPPDHGVRSFLPHDTVDFSGRAAELAALYAGLTQPSANALLITTIGGMGGIGKTALAVHLAHRISADYPDGQYFIDLRGFTPDSDPLSPAEALDVLLRSAGVAVEDVPPDLDGRVAVWRSKTAHKRILVVLDNAADVDQVRPLLPAAAGSIAIVTSRLRLGELDGTTPQFLDVLALSDAVELFCLVAALDPATAPRPTVERIVDLCGRLPLAIRIAASRLRQRPSWAPADLLSRLAGADRRTRFLSVGDRTVGAVLGLSYPQLAPEAARLFRLLGLHPGTDIDGAVAARLLSGTADDAEHALDKLYEANLIQQREPGRYYMHSLVHDCARELADCMEEAECAGRREPARTRDRIGGGPPASSNRLRHGRPSLVYSGERMSATIPLSRTARVTSGCSW